MKKVGDWFKSLFDKIKTMNKWCLATIIISIALVAAIIVAIVLGVSGNKPDAPVTEEGPETGTYYYDAESGEYTIVLFNGNQFTLNDGVVKAGVYTVSGDTISFDFTKDSNGSAEAKLEGDVLTLTYNEQEIRFLKKVNYTVTFNANGGEGVAASASVVNGKLVANPGDPAKAGYVFIGWYADEAMTTPYAFDTAVVTGDKTLYAKWAEKAVGQVEYTVDFEGADVEDMTTIGGKLYNVPTPTKDGYTFGGWWISDYEDGEKLTSKYSEDTVFKANTTLFAVWVKAEGSKLVSPLAEVSENGLSWASIEGASTYSVKIIAPDGIVAYEDNVGATTLNFDFAKAGGYVIEVTAVAANTANNSATTVRYYNSKALDRVSLFTVIEPSTLIFNSVGADKYYITVKCGNEDHNHEMVDNGKSTVFTFINCDMKVGGIEFVVTAVKNGYANSVSETFVCERVLDKVTDATVDAATDTVVWTPVKNAAYYAVTVTVGETTLPTVYVNEASYSLKNVPEGKVTVKVVPVTEGYLSGEAVSVSYTKNTLAAPTGIKVNGNVISWNAVAGATSYVVKVGAKEFETKTATLDLTAVDATFANGEIVAVSVKAVADGKSSVYSDELVAKYNGFDGNLVYSNGVISWTPAIGEGTYDVAVNGTVVANVTDANSYALTFKAAGKYTISVTYLSTVGQETHEIDVTIYAITFDSRLGTGVKTIYVAAGDTLNLPTTSTRPGYTFSGWYNTPTASNGNGKIYDDVFYSEKDSIVLYADWTPNTYKITQKVDANVSGATDGEIVSAVYGKSFNLPIVASDEGSFLGWYTGPGGTGLQLTDARGDSVGVYTNIKDIVAYPYFAQGVLEYYENEDGTYSVTGGFNLGSVIDLVIPDTYNGKPVTGILENAFAAGEYNVKTVSFPNTVNFIGVGAIEILYYLESIDVREVEGNHEVIYSSYEGALIRDYYGVSYLEVFPRCIEGEFTVPSTVDTIRHKVFSRASYLTKLTISKEVTYIADEAFYRCNKLEEIVFEEGGTAPLTIEPTAFNEVKALKTITLPARVENLSLETFDACIALENINVEEGGEQYGSVGGMLTNGARDTIYYCPVTRTGEIVIPTEVLAIGEGAFAGRAGITSVVLHNKMTEVAKGAFEGCGSIKTVTFEGGRNSDLVIGEGAFKGNTGITTVKFGDPDATTADLGAVTIGTSAFEGCTNISELYFANTANIAVIEAAAFKDCSRIPSLTIPATTSNIGDRAFAGCNGILNVAFTAGGVDIAFGDFVFSGCAQLTSISLPATVTVFDGSVFEGCNNITEITVHKDNPALLAEDGVLYNKTKTEIMYYPRAKALDFAALPATLTKIGAAAFQSNHKITSVAIPASITEIGANAFDGCIYLEEVTFTTTSAMIIGDHAFANCPELNAITLPVNLTEIGDYAFYQSGLGKTADENVFGTVVIPATVSYIGDYAFAYTMIGTLTVPASVETLGEGAFYMCKNLSTVTVEEGNKALVIGSAEDEHGVFEGTILTTANLSSRTSVVGVRAFYGLTTLTTVNIPADSKLTTIGEYAFRNTRLTAIALPEGLVSIGVEAFRYVTSLESVAIPSTVTDIGKYSFANMTKLTNLTFAAADTATTPLSINDYAFTANTALVSITLPKRLERVYDSVTLGSGFSMTSFYTVFEGCSKLENIFVADGCVQFSDYQGVFYENDDAGNPSVLIYCPKGKTGEVSVPSTVTLVSNGSFVDTKVEKIVFEEMANWKGESTLRIGTAMTAENGDEPYGVFGSSSTGYYDNNKTLKEVKFPAHLAAVGSYAFQNVGDIYSDAVITITFNREAGPVEFGERAIYSNRGLNELLLPKVGTTAWGSFSGNSYVRKVSFAKGSTVEKIAEWTFTNCGVHYLYDIPASVKIIDDHAFSTSPLKEITWEEGSQIHTIGNSVFSNSTITTFTFPETLEIVGSNALGSKLTEVTLNSILKSTITPTGASIFTGTTSLQKVNVPESNPYMVVVDGAVYSADMSILMYVPSKLPMGEKTAFEIDNRVTVIEASAFESFSYPVVLHEGILEIADRAFYKATLEKITIPASVTKLGEYSFYYMPNLTTVKVAPNSNLTTLGYGAFYYDSKLVDVELPDTVSDMDFAVFQQCTALESIDLPTGLTAIPRFTFSSCKALKNVTIYDNVTVIGGGAFSSCTSLETINIPASVLEFEDYANFGAFEGDTSLKNVNFEEGIQLSNIPGETFKGCVALESLTIPNTVESIAANAFTGCTAIKNLVLGGSWTDLPKEMFKGFVSLETLVLPEGIQTIGASAFEGCTNLEVFNIPESVETIGEAAFRNCSSLESAAIGDKVESIGNYAFEGCSSLKSVVFDENSIIKALGDDPAVESAIFRGTAALTTIALPDSVTTIGANIFEDSGLETVDLPANLKAVSNYAFAGCVSLTEVSIPSTVGAVGDFAFEGCSGLVEAKLATGVESIGTGVFLNCVQLAKVNIPSSIRSMAGNPFINCPSLVDFQFDSNNTDYKFENGAVMDKNKFTLIYYLPANDAETYTIPSTVGVIASGAFCDSQLVSISIPEKVTEIPSMAFVNSKKLETVTFTDSIKSIGSEAFKDCSALTAVTIPETTTTIGDSAFEGCASLGTVTFDNRTADITIGAGAFKDCITLGTINIPEQLTALSDYMLANTAITEFTVPERIESLDVEGVLANCSKLKTVTLHDDLEGNIGTEFFMNCTSLETITLPAGITTVGEIDRVGFRENGIDNWYFEEYGTSVYSGAFKGCTALKSIDLSNVVNIGANAFEGCTLLKDIDFAKEMFSIGDYAFAGCTSLVEVNMFNVVYGTAKDEYYEYNVMGFGEYVFSGCTALTKVSLPGTDDEDYNSWGIGIADIKEGVFAGCTALKLVEIADAESIVMGAKPFEDLSSDCVILFHTEAKYVHSSYFKTYINGYVENSDWLMSTDALVIGEDGGILLKTSTLDAADIRMPVVSTKDGAPLSSIWNFGSNGNLYSVTGVYWDALLPDGKVMPDDAFYFDKDESIYNPDKADADRTDDYLVYAKDGQIYYPDPDIEDGNVLTYTTNINTNRFPVVTFYVMTDATLYTIENGFVTFADSFDPSLYDAIIIKAENAQYILGSSGGKYFTRVVATTEGTTINVVNTVAGESVVEPATQFKADGTVVSDGATIAADRKTVTFADGSKCVYREVTEGVYDWVLVLADTTEYTDGTVYIYEDGTTIIFD